MSEMQDIEVPKRVWGLWATVGFGVLVIVMSFIVQIIVGIIFALVKILSFSGPALILPKIEDALGGYNGLLVSIATTASMIVCVGLILIIIKVRRSTSIAEYLGLRTISGKKILIILLVMAGFIILSDCLSLLIGRPLYPEYMVDIYNTSVWPALFWIALLIFAPVFEESLFRGFLFEGFRQSRLGSIGAIFLTALVWASLHIQYGYYEITTIFFMGIVLGIVRLKTRSLWSTLAMHSFANLVATLEVAFNLNALIS